MTVTDPNVSGLTCTPANGSPLAPGASMTCTATHTVTQADIDAGHYANTACVDDGAGGAAQACDDARTCRRCRARSVDHEGGDGGELRRGRADVIHYTIVATNDGNVTLAAVTVTDPSVSGSELYAGERVGVGSGCVDELHGDAHDHAGRHRRRALREHGLCR